MKQQLPQTVRFLLCDDVRPEATGKVSIIGLYPADVIMVRNMDGQVPPEGLVTVLGQIAIACLALNGNGTYTAGVAITGPSGQNMLSGSLGEFTLARDRNATLIVQSTNLAVPEYGKYTLILTIGKREYPFEFNIVQAPDSIVTPHVSAAPKKAKRTKKSS